MLGVEKDQIGRHRLRNQQDDTSLDFPPWRSSHYNLAVDGMRNSQQVFLNWNLTYWNPQKKQ